jgi:hypothetical protein
MLEAKSFIYSFTNEEISIEMYNIFDGVLEELVDVCSERFCEDTDEEYYTEREIYFEKYSDF